MILQIMGLGVLVLAIICILAGYRMNKYNVSGWECGIVYTFLVTVFVVFIGSYIVINHATSSTRNAILDYKVVKSIVQDDDEDRRGPIRRLLGL